MIVQLTTWENIVAGNRSMTKVMGHIPAAMDQKS